MLQELKESQNNFFFEFVKVVTWVMFLLVRKLEKEKKRKKKEKRKRGKVKNSNCNLVVSSLNCDQYEKKYKREKVRMCMT